MASLICEIKAEVASDLVTVAVTNTTLCNPFDDLKTQRCSEYSCSKWQASVLLEDLIAIDRDGKLHFAQILLCPNDYLLLC